MTTEVTKINGWIIAGWIIFFVLLPLLGTGFIVWNLVTADSSGEGISYLTYAISGATLLLVGFISPLKEIRKWIPAVVTTVGIVMLVYGLYGLYMDWSNDYTHSYQHDSSHSTTCGSKHSLAKTVSSTTTMTRFYAREDCTPFVVTKDQGVPVIVSFDSGPEKKWITGQIPQSTNIKYMDLRLVHSGEMLIEVDFFK